MGGPNKPEHPEKLPLKKTKPSGINEQQIINVIQKNSQQIAKLLTQEQTITLTIHKHTIGNSINKGSSKSLTPFIVICSDPHQNYEYAVNLCDECKFHTVLGSKMQGDKNTYLNRSNKLQKKIEELEILLEKTQQKVKDLKYANKQLSKQINIDPITLIKNNVGFLQDLTAWTKKYTSFSIGVIQINNLHEITEEHGYAIQEKILRYMASKLLMAGEVYKWGLSEFIILKKTDIDIMQEDINALFQGPSLKFKATKKSKDKIQTDISTGVMHVDHKMDLNTIKLSLYEGITSS